ncbi:PREDICTED: twitchin-like [Priapulus caudatus]|uniref:Twitchin-like n=1 Tax=Priapulus caudatus TaxID=37621 RepID=A0ABM1DN74_PRICU|nr:PREDICTED: twitchin-like [Priapulus caudatus]
MRPLFTKDPVMKQTGNKVVMEALVKSDPQARVRWYHHSPDDENLMQDSERYRMKSQENKDGTQVFTLTITAPTLEDSGTYLVKAYNALGENSAKFNLNLGVPAGEGVIPEFLGPPSITDSPDRKAMTIECQVKADPKPTASWIFVEKTLSDATEKYKFPLARE